MRYILTRKISCMLLGLGAGWPAGSLAQQAAPEPRRNVIRIDWISWVAVNATYQMADPYRKTIWPLLISYERSLGPRTSAGAEILLNGWYPDQRRSGASVTGRYYVLPSRRPARLMSGWYLAAGLHYRKLREQQYDLPKSWVTAHRSGVGALAGYQLCFGAGQVRLVGDAAVGAGAWLPVGSDKSSAGWVAKPTRGNSFLGTGLKADCRAGIGLQF